MVARAESTDAEVPPNKRRPSATVESPVPPPSTFRVPVMVSGAKVKVPEELVIAFAIVSPLKVVALEVASVMAPVCAVPNVCTSERRPALLNALPVYVIPVPAVVVAVHVDLD